MLVGSGPYVPGRLCFDEKPAAADAEDETYYDYAYFFNDYQTQFKEDVRGDGGSDPQHWACRMMADGFPLTYDLIEGYFEDEDVAWDTLVYHEDYEPNGLYYDYYMDEYEDAVTDECEDGGKFAGHWICGMLAAGKQPTAEHYSSLGVGFSVDWSDVSMAM
eukprot:TRINITY_DN4385_c0_g1_i1.p1 TRINITY_DN4385_c0_g1~~TRINITY_DN4385_c0_g1_i1.p1  ORF type:complete len:161 (+),score=40.02 TRINITY_DN4385_c0_g1_i1:31-513(+)